MADARKGGDLGGQFEGGVERLAFRRHAVGETHDQGLGGDDRASGQDKVHGPGVPDQAGQANGAEVDEGHAPAAAENAEDRVLGGDA